MCISFTILSYCFSDEAMPSCGSDGVLYDNICELRETQCKTQKEISLRPADFCSGKTPLTFSGVISLHVVRRQLYCHFNTIKVLRSIVFMGDQDGNI